MRYDKIIQRHGKSHKEAGEDAGQQIREDHLEKGFCPGSTQVHGRFKGAGIELLASIEGDFIDPAYSLVSPTFDYRAPRRYLNDHNLAVPFPKTGLSDEDLENFRRHGIDLSY